MGGIDNASVANNTVANDLVANGSVGELGMRKAGGNWVEGENFVGREAELESLAERVRDGTHTLLTAQRRMGKTSLVRELLRRLKEEGEFETIFVDLEDAATRADAVAEIAAGAASTHSVWRRHWQRFRNILPQKVSVKEFSIEFRTGVDAGNWRYKGNQIFTALSQNERPVVLALDELPIFVNRLLKRENNGFTPDSKQTADEFLSWLRKNGQTHRGRVSMILAGSVSLEPILQQADLCEHANIFSPFDLKPWDEATASECLGALADAYGVDLSRSVRHAMCRRLGTLSPHHVQWFFNVLHEDLRRDGRNAATLGDVERVYKAEMLDARPAGSRPLRRPTGGKPATVGA